MADVTLGITFKADGSGLVGEVKRSETAIEKLGRAGTQAAGGLNRLERETEQLTRAQDRLGAVATRVQGRLGAAATSAGAAISGLRTVLAGGLIGIIAGTVREIGHLAIGGIHAGDAIGELAAQIGIGTDALQALGAQAQFSGSSQEELATGVAFLTRKLSDAAQGSKQVREDFAWLGIQWNDGSGRARQTEAVIDDLIGALKGTADESERAGIASTAFGDRIGQRLIPALTGAEGGLRDIIDAAREQGLVMDEEGIQKAGELADKYDLLTAKVHTFWMETTVGIAGAGADLLDWFDKVGDAADEWKVNALKSLGLNPDDFANILFFGAPPGGEIARNPFDVMRGNAGSSGGRPRRGERDGSGGGEREADRIREVIDALIFEQEQLRRNADAQALYNALHDAGVSINSAAGQQIAALVSSNAGLAAQVELAAKAEEERNALVNEGQAILAEMKAEQQAYNDVLARGLEPTEANVQAMMGYNAELARLKLALEAAGASQEEMNRALGRAGGRLNETLEQGEQGWQSWGAAADQAWQSASRTLLDAAINGGSFRDVLREIEQQLLHMIGNKLFENGLTFGGGEAGGGGFNPFAWLFNLISGGGTISGGAGIDTLGSGTGSDLLFHRGGIVGRDGDRRAGVSPLAFPSAPRLHDGLAPGEFRAILQRDEAVIPLVGGAVPVRMMGGDRKPRGNMVVNQYFSGGVREDGRRPTQAQMAREALGQLRRLMR